jgi:hypothetical protein
MVVTLLNSLALIVLSINAVEQAHLKKLVDRSVSLQVGSSQDEVIDLLGQPLRELDARRGLTRLVLGERPAQFVYGSITDAAAVSVDGFPYPNPLAVKIRIFPPYPDDLVVSFSSDEKVIAVSRPEVHVSKEAEELYRVGQFFGAFAHVLTPSNSIRSQPVD